MLDACRWLHASILIFGICGVSGFAGLAWTCLRMSLALMKTALGDCDNAVVVHYIASALTGLRVAWQGNLFLF